MNEKLTAERVRELLDYDAETGVFVWKVGRGRTAKVGDVAGTLDSKGYIGIKVDGRRYQAHRLAWLYVYGVWPKYEIDHLDHSKTNNAIGNLQDVPHDVNPSRRKAFGAIKLKGVSKFRNKFQARITIDGKPKHIGIFENPVDAHLVWGSEAKKLHGDQFFCDCFIHSV